MNTREDDIASDLDALFDADNYLFFYQDQFLTEERTRLEAAFVRERLGIDETTSLLDLACGHGRHANALAKDARLVLGIDTNSRFLEIAKKHASAGGISNATFINKDIRNLDYTEEFERATLLNTVFGLFSDDENYDLLLRINKALKPSGKLCLDVINRDTILVDFQPSGILEKKENRFLLDRLSFNERTGRMTNRRIYLKDGRTTNASFSLRLYNYCEIAALLAAARFDLVEVFADWNATPMDYKSKKMVIIAEKTGDVR